MNNSLRALYPRWVETLELTRLGLQQLRVARVVALLSFGEGRSWAFIPKHDDLALACWLDRGAVCASLGELESMSVVRAVTDGVEPVADTALWKVQWRWRTPGHRAAGASALAALQHAQRTAQTEHPGLLPDPTLPELLAEVSRDTALAALQSQSPSPEHHNSRDARTGVDTVAETPGLASMTREQISRQIAESLGVAAVATRHSLCDDSPQQPCGDSPQFSRARTPACGQLSNVTTVTTIVNNCGAGAAGKQVWTVPEWLIDKAAAIAGQHNRAYWVRVLINEGPRSELALEKAIGTYKERKKPGDDPSRCLLGIFKKCL